MQTILKGFGFEKVINEKVDFYDQWPKSYFEPSEEEKEEEECKSDRVVEFDVLVTNPPFSGDHITKLIHFCFHSSPNNQEMGEGEKIFQFPFFLLLPHYVYTKPFFSPFSSFISFIRPSNPNNDNPSNSQSQSNSISNPYLNPILIPIPHSIDISLAQDFIERNCPRGGVVSSLLPPFQPFGTPTCQLSSQFHPNTPFHPLPILPTSHL